LVRARLEQETYGLTEIQGYFAREKLDPRLGARTRVTVAFFGYKNNLASIKFLWKYLYALAYSCLNPPVLKQVTMKVNFSKELRVYFFPMGRLQLGWLKINIDFMIIGKA